MLIVFSKGYFPEIITVAKNVTVVLTYRGTLLTGSTHYVKVKEQMKDVKVKEEMYAAREMKHVGRFLRFGGNISS